MSQHIPDDDTHLRETEIESTPVFRGRLLEVRLDRVRQPDGHETTREYVRHQGAVVIIPILDDGRLLFERQFRYPSRRAFLEFPAGKIDPGEEILTTGQRELLEETGYVAREWRYLGVMHPCIGYSNEKIEIFVAQHLVRQSDQALDHGEFPDLLTLSLDEAIDGVRSGAITDGKTITALFWAEKVIRSGW